MAEADFQRARNASQKEERRAGLLETAERLLRERGDVSGFSLNELAREAGMAKSNVYRYFESRESLLLELLEEQWKLWFGEFVRSGEGTAAVPLSKFCEDVTASLGKKELLCALMSALPSVLEHNASKETILEFKLRSLEFIHSLAEHSHGRCPELEVDELEKLLHFMTLVMTSLWAYSNPSKTVLEALEDPRLEGYRRDFPRELAGAMLLMARGMLASRFED